MRLPCRCQHLPHWVDQFDPIVRLRVVRGRDHHSNHSCSYRGEGRVRLRSWRWSLRYVLSLSPSLSSFLLPLSLSPFHSDYLLLTLSFLHHLNHIPKSLDKLDEIYQNIKRGNKPCKKSLIIIYNTYCQLTIKVSSSSCNLIFKNSYINLHTFSITRSQCCQQAHTVHDEVQPICSVNQIRIIATVGRLSWLSNPLS